MQHAYYKERGLGTRNLAVCGLFCPSGVGVGIMRLGEGLFFFQEGCG